MSLRIAIYSVSLLCALACSTASTVFELPSGKKIRNVNVTKMNFPKGGPALVLTYETDIPIENMTVLRDEVDELWVLFRKDVEAAQVKGAAIRAVHNDTDGFVKNGKGYGFIFLQDDLGQWRCIDDDNP